VRRTGLAHLELRNRAAVHWFFSGGGGSEGFYTKPFRQADGATASGTAMVSIDPYDVVAARFQQTSGPVLLWVSPVLFSDSS
jgi:hypothetical protein